MTAPEPSPSEPNGAPPVATAGADPAFELGGGSGEGAGEGLAERDVVAEPAPVLRRAITALWVGYLPLWLVILAMVTPSVPVVLAAFALFVLLLVRLHQGLRRFRCARCGGRYYARDLFGVLGGNRCAGCGR